MAVNVVNISIGKDIECSLGMGSNAQILMIANIFANRYSLLLQSYLINSGGKTNTSIKIRELETIIYDGFLNPHTSKLNLGDRNLNVMRCPL